MDVTVGWTPKNLCFQTVMLEKTLESPLDSKKIKPVNPKENQPWIFNGRTSAKAETPVLWPPQRVRHNWATELNFTETMSVQWLPVTVYLRAWVESCKHLKLYISRIWERNRYRKIPKWNRYTSRYSMLEISNFEQSQ